MPKKLDPFIADKLKEYGFGLDACWDSHGTWVVYHKVLEQIATKAGVKFQSPFVASSAIENVAICVTGELGEQMEWSIGESSPKNNKNAYPWAMAEKRAKDRVILKLIGLHGFAYSEEEADDFKDSKPDRGQMHGPLGITDLKEEMKALSGALANIGTPDQLSELEAEYSAVLEQCERDLPDWYWGKDGTDIKGARERIDELKQKLEYAA